MIAETSPITEVVVSIVPERPEPSQEAETDDVKRESDVSYEALIYTDPQSLQNQADFERPKDHPDRIGALKLAAVERVSVNWDYYRRYLRSFIRGEKEAYRNLNRGELFNSISPGLEKLLNGEAIDKRPLRVWWKTPPSLAELPWELLAYGDNGTMDQEISFVRGQPPNRPVPVLPVGQKLRLAFIHDPNSTSQVLVNALKDLPNIDVVSVTDQPLQALQRAVGEGFELVHLVAEGSVTLACEGFLYLRKSRVAISSDAKSAFSRRALRLILSSYELMEPRLPKSWSAWLSSKLYKELDLEILSTSELSALQHGSPLAVLCLSPPKSSGDGSNRIDAILLPSIYRAFACIGNSPLPMPNIVAQISVTDEQRMAQFWQGFYVTLGESLQVERAMRKARQDSAQLTMALFLRQQHSQTFKYSETPRDLNVTQINAELAESEETLEELKAWSKRHSGLSDILKKFGKGEVARREQLKSKLQDWLPEQRGESDEPGHKD